MGSSRSKSSSICSEDSGKHIFKCILPASQIHYCPSTTPTASMASTNDPRFARLATDPRFLRPSKLKNKVVLDDRFKGILENDSEYNQAKSKVDKYGRKVGKDAKKNDLREFYRLEDGGGDGDGDEVDAAGSSSSKKGKGKGKGKSTSAAAGSVLSP